MTRPDQLGEDVVASLTDHFDHDQLVELTLKVMKFNIQKVMVALDTDEILTEETLAAQRWNADGTYVVAPVPPTPRARG